MKREGRVERGEGRQRGGSRWKKEGRMSVESRREIGMERGEVETGRGIEVDIGRGMGVESGRGIEVRS